MTTFCHATLLTVVSCVTQSPLWLAAPWGVEPPRATLWGACFEHILLRVLCPSPSPPVHSLQGISLNTLYLCASWRTLLWTCSIRSRRQCSSWLAACWSSVSSWPRGFLVGIRISTSGSLNARKPRSCNNWLPDGSG